jgi:hypothetical protein
MLSRSKTNESLNNSPRISLLLVNKFDFLRAEPSMAGTTQAAQTRL